MTTYHCLGACETPVDPKWRRLMALCGGRSLFDIGMPYGKHISQARQWTAQTPYSSFPDVPLQLPAKSLARDFAAKFPTQAAEKEEAYRSRCKAWCHSRMFWQQAREALVSSRLLHGFMEADCRKLRVGDVRLKWRKSENVQD
jgi:hypothetical protein